MQENSSPTLSESCRYALLAHRRRRLLLRILQDFPAPLSIAELAEIIADCEHETATDRDRQQVLLSLYHAHLPGLADAAVVDYDHEDGTVRTGSNFGVLVGMLADECEERGQFAD